MDQIIPVNYLLSNNDNASNHIDRAMDAENISILESDAGWLIDDKNCIINIRPIEIKDQIPLEIILNEPSALNFEIAENMNFTYPVYIFDSLTKETHSLNNSEKFNIELDKGNYRDRFFMTFYKEDLIASKDITPEIIVEHIGTFQNQEFKRLEINLPSTLSATEIELFDDRGRKIKQLKATQADSYYEISTTNLSHGLYILKIKDAKGKYFSKKIIISK